jgi:DNA-binding HxlR family transcriptional regulator
LLEATHLGYGPDMTRTSTADLPCSVARALDVLGDTWTLLVLRDAYLGQRRFSEFAAHLPIARNVLADRLATLVDNGLLVKVRYQERPPRDEYRLTDKGRDLFGVIAALLAWGDRWLTPDDEPVPLTLVHTTCGTATTALVVCDHCGDPLSARDVRYTPQLGQTLPSDERVRSGATS